MHSRISARSYVKTRSWVCKSASKKMMSEGQIIIDHLFGGLLGWRILLSSTKKEKRMSINVSKICRRLGALHPFASHNGQGRILWGLIQPQITVQGERSLEKQLWCSDAHVQMMTWACQEACHSSFLEISESDSVGLEPLQAAYTVGMNHPLSTK